VSSLRAPAMVIQSRLDERPRCRGRPRKNRTKTPQVEERSPGLCNVLPVYAMLPSQQRCTRRERPLTPAQPLPPAPCSEALMFLPHPCARGRPPAAPLHSHIRDLLAQALARAPCLPVTRRAAAEPCICVQSKSTCQAGALHGSGPALVVSSASSWEPQQPCPRAAQRQALSMRTDCRWAPRLPQSYARTCPVMFVNALESCRCRSKGPAPAPGPSGGQEPTPCSGPCSPAALQCTCASCPAIRGSQVDPWAR